MVTNRYGIYYDAVNKKDMKEFPSIMKKSRLSLGDSGVMPLAPQVHYYLMLSYLLWPLTIIFSQSEFDILFTAGVGFSFLYFFELLFC